MALRATPARQTTSGPTAVHTVSRRGVLPATATESWFAQRSTQATTAARARPGGMGRNVSRGARRGRGTLAGKMGRRCAEETVRELTVIG